ncbi:hypothetical protein EYF80_043042 [Liparis tanakae]|uniref:Uncharacterized protein n=1 Tax=Liparis tanakae TaxID=230148 RepID=A0A4Z2FZT5_9TELE|nr:hypothetical protein EYF80_043042 [Liparis tanakae]
MAWSKDGAGLTAGWLFSCLAMLANMSGRSPLERIPAGERCALQRRSSRNQNARPPPELSPITEAAEGGSGGAARLPKDAAWQALDSWPEQLPAGETARLRNNRSMEGCRGCRRLTGQKAEPPWGLKFTLLGSGQEERRAGLGWRGAL